MPRLIVYSKLTDSELVDKATNGDGRALDALVERYAPRVNRLASQLMGDLEEARDAAQESLVKVCTRLKQFRGEAQFATWLHRLVVNTCRDRGRARSRAPEEVSLEGVTEFSLYRQIAVEDPFPYSDSLHLDFLARFEAEDVRAVLARLPDRNRVPMLLVYVDGFTTKEVAGMLDTPVGTVLAWLHRGRKLFERELWDYAETHGLLVEQVR